MKRALLCLALLSLSCTGNQSQRPYDNSDLQLITGYTAKEFCSCLFVMEMPMAYCRAWTRASPQVAKVGVDFDRKVVEAIALIQWSARAHYDGPRFGCVLEP